MESDARGGHESTLNGVRACEREWRGTGQGATKATVHEPAGGGVLA